MKKITLTDFTENQTKGIKQWHCWLSLCLIVLFGKTSFAQVSAYSFAQSQGVYQSIESDGELVSGSAADGVTTYDTSGWDIALPFTFNMNSINFNSIHANSNGGAVFGLANTGSLLISSNTAYSSAIAAMNRDLWGIFYTSGNVTNGSTVITNVASFRGIAVGKLMRTGSGIVANTTVASFDETAGTITLSAAANATTAAASIGWGSGKMFTKTDGVAPNRIFTIQWEGYNDYGASAASSNYLSFQIKLSETSNKVQVIYGTNFNINATSRTNQVGLRGASNADFNNRIGAVANSWNNTAAGIVNSASVSRDNVNFPASGLTFSWLPPTCLPPGELTATAITTTSATLSWTNTGTAYDLQWGIQGFAMGSGTVVSGVTSPYVLNGLAPSTSYSFYVRTNCGAADGLSNWAGPYNFVTACGLATAFSENFDTYTATGTNNPLPNCWTRFGNTGSSYITTGSAVPLTAPNRLFLSGSFTGGTNGVAVMPPVSNLQAQTHRLRFMAYATAAAKSLEIGYYDSYDDASSFVVLEAFEMPSTAIANATEFIYAPQSIPTGIQSLAFRVNGSAFAGTTTIYVDNVIWEPLPGCFDINVVTFTNVGSSTADVEWENGGSEQAWEYVYAPNTVNSPVGLTPTLVNNNPYAALSGLLASTNYNFWIRSVCSNNAVGNWSSVKTFTTACAPVTALPWTESFENIVTVGTTAFPPCWVKQNGDWATAIVSGYNTPKSGTKYLRDSYAATNEFMWTPGFALTAGVSYDFSFYMQGDGFTGWNVDVFQNTQQTSVDAAQLGETIIATGLGSAVMQQYQLVSNTIVPTSTGVYYFAIRVNQPSSSPWYIAFDDFKMEVTPSCVAPTVETATDVTSTTATVSWTSDTAPSNGFQYFLTTDSALVPNASTVPTGTVAGGLNQIALSSLNPSTLYKFYVKALCSSSDTSSWSAAGTFTTACGLVTVFSENFDTYATGTTTPLPLCWQRAGNGTTYITTGGVAPGTAPNRLYLFATGAAPATQAIAIMPSVSNLQANTHRLKFKAYSTSSATGRYLEIGYFTDTNDLSTFMLIESVNLPGTAAGTAQTFTINPLNIPAGVNALAFRNPGTATTSTALYIDDVIWEAKPTLAPVCTTNVIATPNTTCGNFATVITWDATANADGYNLTIGTTAGGTIILDNQNIGTVTSYNFLGTAGTTYFYTVTPYNSAGAATGCSAQTFVTVVNACYCTSIPTSNDGAGISNVQVGNQNFPTGDVMYFDHTATPVDFSQGILNNLKVTLATGFTYGTNVWIDLNNNYNFEPNELFFSEEAPNTNPFVQDASFILPVNAPLGQHRMRIVATDIVQVPANPCYSGTYGVTLDFTINVTAAPTCLAPLGLNVVATSITTNAATVNWTASSTIASEGYEYYYATSNVAPTAATTPSGSVAAGINTVNLTGLASSSIHYVYVRAVCSASDKSGWSQAVSFTTLCDTASLPYMINFESVTVPNLPLCTSNQNVGLGNNWVTVASTGNGFTSKALKYNYNGTNAANTWFFTNNVALTAGTQYTISYKYGNNSATFVESLKVAYGTSGTSTAMTTVLADHPTVTGGNSQNNTVTFSPSVSGNYTFGFHAYSILNQLGLLVDDILIQEVLSNGSFENNRFTAYPNPVKNNLTIRYNENISDVTVFNLLGQQLFSRSINATEGKVDMSNLSAGTYLVKVTSGDKVQTIKVIKE